MQWNWPVETNNMESVAYCNWLSEKTGKKVRLPSHEENYWMRDKAKYQTANLNLNEYASPSPVDMFYG